MWRCVKLKGAPQSKEMTARPSMGTEKMISYSERVTLKRVRLGFIKKNGKTRATLGSRAIPKNRSNTDRSRKDFKKKGLQDAS